MFSLDYGWCFISSAFWVCFDFSRYVSYRFRLISISCDPAFNFSIDGHQMTVIEVEGTNTQPLLIDSLQIFVGASVFIRLFVMIIDVKTGQRYSVVVCPFRSPSIGMRISSIYRSRPINLWITTVSFICPRYFVVSRNIIRDSFSPNCCGSELQ